MQPTTKIPAITGDPAMDGLIMKGIVALVMLVVPWLMTHLKLSDPEYAVWLTATLISVLVGVATFVWGWFLTQINQAKAVQAGVNLTTSGNALAADGSVITKFQADSGSTPPKPVTVASAQQIVKDFAPATIPKAA
jgi:hypothetical protein